jgi:hypothetical protein
MVLVLANLMNGADVGMIQGRSNARLALETFQILGVRCKVVRKEFYRYKAAELGVLALSNGPRIR